MEREKELQYSLLAVTGCLYGVIFNTIAWRSNGGKMPVYNPRGEYLASSEIHQIVDSLEGINYKFFIDWIDLHFMIISVGDILIVSSLFFIAIVYIKNYIDARRVKLLEEVSRHSY